MSFNANGGSITNSPYGNPHTFNYGDTLDTSLIGVSRTGYTADGWRDSVGNWYTTWIVTDNVTLYASWTANEYTVTLDKQDGSGGDDYATATYGSAMPAITVPTRTGYTFGGYYTSANGGGTQYYTASGASTKNWDKTSDTTLYAKWTVNQYTVTLDMQSGSGGSPSATATYGSAMPAITVPTRTGYTFGGYYTSTNGGGTQYYTAFGTSAKVWDKTSDTTLYAKWTANTYTVTFDKQSGSGGTSSVTATYGKTLQDQIETPTRTGYTFGGYYTEVNGGGTRFYSGIGWRDDRTWNIAAATTLYAKWTTRTYAITVNPNGGIFRGSASASTYDTDTKKLVTGTNNGYNIHVATRTGHTLVGYYDAQTGGNLVYDANGFAVNGTYWDGNGSVAKFKGLASASATSLTVYARWTANTYTVTLDRQDGSGGSPSATATYGSAMPAITVPTRTGYTFGGYYTSANGGGTQYYTASGASTKNWDIAEATILYAKWTARTYTLIVSPNGGVYSGKSTSTTYDQSVKKLETGTAGNGYVIFEATRTGHTLVGYYDAQTGGNLVYDANGLAVNGTYWDGNGSVAKFKGLASASATSLTVYARWTAKTCTVTLDMQEGTGGTASVTATYGSAMPSITMLPDRTGYVFGGYYSGTDGSGTQYYTSAGASVRNWDIESATATLYAKWTPRTYNVTLNKQYGSGGTDSVTATYGKQLQAITVPNRTGYVFGGYYTGTNGSGTQYYSSVGYSWSDKPWVTASDSTLYAKWTPVSYSVKFNANGGTGTMANESFTYDVSKSLTENAFTRVGYTYKGWATSASGAKAYNDSAIVLNLTATADGIVNLYAVWQANTYQVTLDKQSGNGGDSAVTATYDQQLPAPISVPTRTGYTFGGYYSSSGGGGTQYYSSVGYSWSSKPWVTASGSTLYAKWTAKTCTVTFDKQSGSGGTSSVTATYDSAMPAITIPTRQGYNFGGYFSSTGGSGTQYYTQSGASARISNLATATTLYAKWTARTYVLKVDPCGGSFRGYKDVYTYEDRALETGTNGASGYEHKSYLIHIAARTGHTLVGYYDAQTGGNLVYDANGLAVSGTYWDGNGSVAKFKGLASASATSLTVYARWTARTYKLVVHANGGTYHGVSGDFVYPDDDVDYNRSLRTGSTAINVLWVATRSGFVLAGYYTSPSGGTKVYDASGNAVKCAYWTDDRAHSGKFVGLADANATQFEVYAQWKASVTARMSVVCGDTDAQGSVPEVCGRPTVKVGSASGSMTAEAVVVQGNSVKVSATASVTGMSLQRITARDGSGTIADMEPPVSGGFGTISFVVRDSDIEVRAIYGRSVVSVSVSKGDASSSVDAQCTISPSSGPYRYGDTVSFNAGNADSASFFCWSDSPSAPTSDPAQAMKSATYGVTLVGDIALYAHYAKGVSVMKSVVLADGSDSDDEGGSVMVFSLGNAVSSPDSGFSVPLGGEIGIASSADSAADYRFVGIKYRSVATKPWEDTGHGVDATFQPKAGYYKVVFQKNPPFVYLACVDKINDGDSGTVGQTVATYNGSEEGAFEPVTDGIPEFSTSSVDLDGARWYKIRAGTSVTLSASIASDSDALSWKSVEYRNLTRANASQGATPQSASPEEGNSPNEVWRERSFLVGSDIAVMTTWAVYPEPKVTLVSRAGGRAAFQGEPFSVREKTFPAELVDGSYQYQTATVNAEPSDGYVFVGWYSRNLSQIVSNADEYSFEVRQDEIVEAVFRMDDNAVFEWEGGTSRKTVEWRSGVITVPMPTDPVAARIDATGYPVELDVGTYSSPDDEPTRQHEVEVSSQDGRRLPRLRPERFWRLSVRAAEEIDAVVVATNMSEVN